MMTGIIRDFSRQADVTQANLANLCQHTHGRPPSVQGVRDLVIEMTGLVIAAKLAQRRLVQVKHNLAQSVGWGITGGKTLPVNLAQGADQGGAVLVADFTILLAVVETCLAHAALPCADAQASSRWDGLAIVHCNRDQGGLALGPGGRRATLPAI